MKCENCSHAEMCKWVDELEGRGCDFYDNKPCDDAISREAFITRYREWMKSEYGKTIPFEVVAWMPLPKPYEPQESEEQTE